MDCILASYTEIVTQHRAIDIGLPDHQLIYCTKKISGIKRGSHEKIKFCSIVINYSKKIKKSTLHVDKDIYNAARYKLQKMIFNKKSVFFFQNKWTESIGKLKELWEA